MRRFLQILIGIVLTLGLVVLIAQDPATVRFNGAVPVTDPRFVEYASAVTSSPATRGDHYEMLLNGDEVYPAMLEAIRAARKRVNLFTYTYNPGEAGDMFTRALTEAAARGVETNVLVDAFGGDKMPSDHVKQLEGAGAFVGRFRPLHWYSIQESSYRNHRQILVVDGETALTGGFSMWMGRGALSVRRTSTTGRWI